VARELGNALTERWLPSFTVKVATETGVSNDVAPLANASTIDEVLQRQLLLTIRIWHDETDQVVAEPKVRLWYEELASRWSSELSPRISLDEAQVIERR
jgi:hypothetical protein